jgi:polysaccharide export outer membrane protein
MRALRSREDEFARSGQSNPDLDAWLNTRMLEQSKAARQSVQGVVKAAQADRDAAIAYRDDLAAQYRAVLADSRRRPTTSSAPKVTITIVKPPVADVPPPMIEPASGLRLAPAMVEPVDAAPTDAPESKSAPEQPVLPDGQVSSQATQTISIIGDVALPGSDLQTAPGTPVPTRVDDSKPQDGGSTVAPKAKTLLVTGEVKSPGPVGFTTGMTVKDAITAAGGVTERAATSRITITRLDPKTGKPTKIQAKDTTLVEADDVIMVPKRYF